jgi:hypothetical protein
LSVLTELAVGLFHLLPSSAHFLLDRRRVPARSWPDCCRTTKSSLGPFKVKAVLFSDCLLVGFVFWKFVGAYYCLPLVRLSVISYKISRMFVLKLEFGIDNV